MTVLISRPRWAWMAAEIMLGAVLLAGCEGELPPPPRQPGARAVQTPVSVNSPENEIIGNNPTAVPLVRVELPNHEDEPAKVTTIVDEVRRVAAPASQPATRPSGRPADVTPAPRGSIDTSATQP